MTEQASSIVCDQGIHGARVRTIQPLRAGDVIFRLMGDVVHEPGQYTLQLDTERHLLNLSASWTRMNHSCNPNTHMDIARRRVVALHDIPAESELVFDYNTTEWDIAAAFVCGCGATNCVGTVRGFRHLNAAQREALRPWLSPLLLARFDD